MIIHRILKGLHKKYEIFCSIVRNKETLLDLDTLTGLLLAEEQTLKDNEPSSYNTEEVLMARFRATLRNRRRGGFFRSGAQMSNKNSTLGGRNTYQGGQNVSSANTKHFDMVICHRCGESGHPARLCMAPAPVREAYKPQHGGSYQNRSGQYLISEEESDQSPRYEEELDDEFNATFAVFSAEAARENWIIDSGVSQYYACHLRSLDKMQSTTSTQTIKSVGGQTHSIIARGDAEFCNTSGEISNITDVCYVPRLTLNLLSVGQFSYQGHVEFFCDERCMVVTRRTPFCVVAKGIRTPNGLYRLTDVYEHHQEPSIAASCKQKLEEYATVYSKPLVNHYPQINSSQHSLTKVQKESVPILEPLLSIETLQLPSITSPSETPVQILCVTSSTFETSQIPTITSPTSSLLMM